MAQIIIGGQRATPDNFDQLVRDGLKRWHEKGSPTDVAVVPDDENPTHVLHYPRPFAGKWKK